MKYIKTMFASALFFGGALLHADQVTVHNETNQDVFVALYKQKKNLSSDISHLKVSKSVEFTIGAFAALSSSIVVSSEESDLKDKLSKQDFNTLITNQIGIYRNFYLAETDDGSLNLYNKVLWEAVKKAKEAELFAKEQAAKAKQKFEDVKEVMVEKSEQVKEKAAELKSTAQEKITEIKTDLGEKVSVVKSKIDKPVIPVEQREKAEEKKEKLRVLERIKEKAEQVKKRVQKKVEPVIEKVQEVVAPEVIHEKNYPSQLDVYGLKNPVLVINGYENGKCVVLTDSAMQNFVSDIVFLPKGHHSFFEGPLDTRWAFKHNYKLFIFKKEYINRLNHVYSVAKQLQKNKRKEQLQSSPRVNIEVKANDLGESSNVREKSAISIPLTEQMKDILQEESETVINVYPKRVIHMSSEGNHYYQLSRPQINLLNKKWQDLSAAIYFAPKSEDGDYILASPVVNIQARKFVEDNQIAEIINPVQFGWWSTLGFSQKRYLVVSSSKADLKHRLKQGNWEKISANHKKVMGRTSKFIIDFSNLKFKIAGRFSLYTPDEWELANQKSKESYVEQAVGKATETGLRLFWKKFFSWKK